MKERLLIAAGVVGGVLCLFLAAYIANGWGQIKTTGTYIPPKDLVDMFKMVLGASVVVLTLGSMPACRRLLGITADDESKAKEIENHCHTADGACICGIDGHRSSNHICPCKPDPPST